MLKPFRGHIGGLIIRLAQKMKSPRWPSTAAIRVICWGDLFKSSHNKTKVRIRTGKHEIITVNVNDGNM